MSWKDVWNVGDTDISDEILAFLAMSVCLLSNFKPISIFDEGRDTKSNGEELETRWVEWWSGMYWHRGTWFWWLKQCSCTDSILIEEKKEQDRCHHSSWDRQRKRCLCSGWRKIWQHQYVYQRSRTNRSSMHLWLLWWWKWRVTMLLWDICMRVMPGISVRSRDERLAIFLHFVRWLLLGCVAHRSCISTYPWSLYALSCFYSASILS